MKYPIDGTDGSGNPQRTEHPYKFSEHKGFAFSKWDYLTSAAIFIVMTELGYQIAKFLGE